MMLIDYGLNSLLFLKICVVVQSIDLLSMWEREHCSVPHPAFCRLR